MRKLLNTLYVTSPDSYLSLDGENIVIRRDDVDDIRIPLHNLEGIVSFGYTGASPALMGACAEKSISLCFMTQSGRFLARVTGKVHGNVTLRKTQTLISQSESASVTIAKNMIIGKLFNARWVIERATRDHPLRLDVDKLKQASYQLKKSIDQIHGITDLDMLRGVEGEAATQYFRVFDDLILQQKDAFFFQGRSRRPPMDNVNAILSFIYTLLANESASALETVGLDPYIGFMHRDRPGRISLALDIMEELRHVLADRFVLSMINKQEISKEGFTTRESGAVIMDEKTRKKILTAWQLRKQEIIVHPFLNEKIPWGLVPYCQAMLLARHLRGDLESYPPFLWK